MRKVFLQPDIKPVQMQRAEHVKNKAKQLIKQSQRPSAARIAQKTGYSIQDVHRCLNYLEKNNEVQTYTKEVLGMKHRMVGVNRQ
jgi:predicted ArsR family transcriptional regulator